MSRFASKKLNTIDLWEWEWVKIRSEISTEDILNYFKAKTEIEQTKIMFTQSLKEWNIKDEDGNIPELNEENIFQLDPITIVEITWPLNDIYNKAVNKFQDNKEIKKKLQNLQEQSTEKKDVTK